MKTRKYFSPGITLIETIFAFALLAIVLVVVFSFLLFSQNTYRSSSYQADIAQNGRMAMDRLTREIRAGSEIKVPAPEHPTGSSIRIKDYTIQDVDTIGTADNPRYIFYTYDGTNKQLLRHEGHCYNGSDIPQNYEPRNASDGCDHSPFPETPKVPIAEFVDSVTFNLADPSVKIILVLKKGDKSITLDSEVQHRNK